MYCIDYYDKAYKAFQLFLCVVFLFILSACETTKPEIDNEVKRLVLPGYILILFADDVTDEFISEFESDYSDYDLKFEYFRISFIERLRRIRLFSFNHHLIDEMEFLEIIRGDSRVEVAHYNHTIVDDVFTIEGLWVIGEVIINLHNHIIGELFDDFIADYSHFGMYRIRNLLRINTGLYVHNVDIVHYYFLLNILIKDERVLRASLNRYQDQPA
jgi:hypothetical protein